MLSRKSAIATGSAPEAHVTISPFDRGRPSTIRLAARDAVMGPALMGLGPKSRVLLAAIGVADAESLRAADAFELYARAKAHDPHVSLNLLDALIGAQQGRHWRDVARGERLTILLRLDAMGIAPK